MGKVVLSSLAHIDSDSSSENPSVKMVFSGVEHYQVDGRPYAVTPDRFIVVDNDAQVALSVDSDDEVKGACFFPAKNLLNEVAQTRRFTLERLLDFPFEHQKLSIVHAMFSYQDSRVGNFLRQQAPHALLEPHQSMKGDYEAFMARLAECIIDDQLELEGRLRQIPTAKKATKQELYRRVAAVKALLDEQFTQKINLDNLAKEAHLSKYHFMRTFKALFHLSPYQYLLRLRLNKARELLALDYSYQEASDLTGFSDGNNLRKAIKKMAVK